MTYKPFVWAEGEKANVKEPVEILKEQGWRYGDVPTASNVNWLFKNIGDQLGTLSKEISLLKQTLDQDITRLTDKSERLRRCTRVLERSVNQNQRHNGFNESILWQMNEGIKAMEQQLRTFHPGYQPITWPLINGTPPRHRDELSDIFDEIDRAEALVSTLEAERTRNEDET